MSDPGPLFHQAAAALTRYFIADQTLGDTLHQIAELTIQAIPAVDHAGITMLIDGKLATSVFTHPEVPEIDRAQYRTGDGPCVDAFRNGEPYGIESTSQPGRWQAFRDSALRHGVRSTLSLPLIANAEPIGALNLYAEVEHAFDEETQHVAELFASQAAFVLVNAQAYWDARTLSENLTQAMASRAEIEQAKGIIMSTTRCTQDEAFELLKNQSQILNIKVRELAAEIVRNTARRSPSTD